MKFLFIALMLIANAACESATNDVPEEARPEDTTQNDPPNTSPEQSEAGPGEVIFDIMVLETYNASKEICGLSKDHVVFVEVMEVKETGMGITNLPHKKQQILINFHSPADDLETNSLIEATARESRCPDASKTFYTVKSYKILQ